MRVGILALQGDFTAHARALEGPAVETIEIRRVHQLDGLDGLVLPGGESTTLLNLMADEPWFESLRSFHASGGVLFGTCAGAILLAREVRRPPQPGLGLLDAVIERNAYGRQVDSFEAELQWTASDRPLNAAFIRAPRFVSVGSDVEVLATLDSYPVLVRQGHVLACTFHSELTPDRRIHLMFLQMIKDRFHDTVTTTPESVAG